MVEKDQLRTRLDSHSLLLRALVEVLINAGVTTEQRLHEMVVSRGLTWRIKGLRDLLKMLKPH
jgi:hypothetical protein